MGKHLEITSCFSPTYTRAGERISVNLAYSRLQQLAAFLVGS
jgi:hypothetical protein